MSTSEERDDTEKRGDEWVKNGQRVKWYRLLFKDDMNHLFEINTKENQDVLNALKFEGKTGTLQYSLSYYKNQAKIKFYAFVPAK